MEKAWKRIRLIAELPDVRLHDLRHTFASWSVMGGQTLFMTGGLLGHASAQTTSRYAHLAADPLRQAADNVSETLAEALLGQSPK
ncbi:MAG: tyrosine-type recombinase/integrase [Rhodospirillaceae bacterium]|jgi:integrase|nr:tyrosine-type recombinase/integrase [Rhodospirillaceae bacterium]MBT4044528.1 tyrosine-type recombinase/integrase [Rhodospirillaceae bacterium]MBT4688203.1 tyrosine-type recombinase/integrase [Rhodospirillaceae bacterium]MBT5079196.1 tyrosine-type recombinase/integrase [Rhodospirillaceae bacterium]MBT6983026.1 tyrosine-type recombinase/integrase [Rhodospirillaceae bacterium]